MLVLAIQTGLRVSGITVLTCQDVRLGTGAHVWCRGKGHKEHVTPLTDQTVGVLRIWLAERRGQPAATLFPRPGGALLSRDAVALIVSKHATTASARCPSLAHKKVSPHVLGHPCAMQLLLAGVDTSTIALWLGHEDARTTQIYLHADLALKERVLARTAPLDAPAGRYRPPRQPSRPFWRLGDDTGLSESQFADPRTCQLSLHHPGLGIMAHRTLPLHAHERRPNRKTSTADRLATPHCPGGLWPGRLAAPVSHLHRPRVA